MRDGRKLSLVVIGSLLETMYKCKYSEHLQRVELFLLSLFVFFFSVTFKYSYDELKWECILVHHINMSMIETPARAVKLFRATLINLQMCSGFNQKWNFLKSQTKWINLLFWKICACVQTAEDKEILANIWQQISSETVTTSVSVIILCKLISYNRVLHQLNEVLTCCLLHVTYS